MNAAEKVATLEALLKKVQRNAALPRQRSQAAAGATTPTATAQPYRAPEPSFDDVISAIEAHSPEGFPTAGKSPKLTALAPPLNTPPAAQAKPAATPATPAAPGVAKAQPAAAARAPAAPGVAKAQPAPAAKAPATTAARAPAAARAESTGKQPEAAKPAPKAPGLFDLPRTPSTPDFDSELSFADVLPEEPRPKAPARAEPPQMPRKPAEAARVTPLPDATRPATPAINTAPGVGAPAEVKSAIAEARAKKEPAIADRDDHVVDDEPTVVRTGLEDELAAATRKPIEDEETAVASQRSQARAIEHSIAEEKTVEAASVEAAAAALRAEVEAEKAPKPAEAKEAPKPAEAKEVRRPAEAKEAPRPAEAKEAPKPKETASSRDDEPTDPGRRRPQLPKPGEDEQEGKEGKRSPSLVLLAVAACILAAAAAYWGFSKYGGGSPTPPAPTPTDKAGTAPTATQATPPTATQATPPPSAAPTTSAAAPPDTAPTASAAAPPADTAAPPAVDASALPPTKGYIVVTSPEVATVYVNGVYAGKTGEPLVVLCGTRNVRLGKLTTDAKAVPDWISPGVPAIIACKSTTSVSLAPGASPPAPRPGPAPGPAPAPAPQPGGGEPYP